MDPPRLARKVHEDLARHSQGPALIEAGNDLLEDRDGLRLIARHGYERLSVTIIRTPLRLSASPSAARIIYPLGSDGRQSSMRAK